MSSNSLMFPRRLWVAARWSCLAWVALAGALVGAPARAQDADPGLIDEGLLLDDIPSVFGASKYEQKVTDAPSAVSIITAEEIARYGFRDFTDVLRSVRGMWVTFDREYPYIGVRGFGRGGDFNARVLVLVDGRRTNEPIFDSGGIEMPTVDLSMVDRIEVIRGPTSALYGTNAVFGVINIITRRGRDLGGVEVGLAADTLGAMKGWAGYGARYESGLEVALSGALTYDLGQDLYFPEFDAPETGNGWSRGADALLRYNSHLRLAWRQLSFSAGFSRRKKGTPTASYETIFPTTRSHIQDNRYFAEVAYEDSFAAGLGLLARLTWERYTYDGAYYRDDADLGDAPHVVTNRDEAHTSSIGGEVRADWAAAEWLRLTAGFEVRHHLEIYQTNFDEEVWFENDRANTHLGTYVQSEWTLLPELTLNASLRYDWYETFGGVASPRAALILRPVESTTVKLLYGEAFRAPNAYELYYEDGGVSKPPTGLDPERMRSFEAVIEQRLGARLQGSVSGYFNNIRSLIDFVEDPTDHLLTYVNSGEMNAWGLEVQLDAQLAEQLAASLSYTWQNAEDIATGEAVTNSPTHMVKLAAWVPLVDRRLQVGLTTQIMSPRRTVAGTTTATVVLVNVNVSSEGLVPGLRLALGAYNLLDLDYGDPAGLQHRQAEIPQNGLSLRASASYSF